MAWLIPIVACGGKTAEEEPKPAEVPTITADTAKVTRRTLVDDVLVRGTVAAVPNEDVKVSALVPGRVNSVTVAEGDTVTRGQVIAELDRQPLIDQRRQAAAAVEQAKAQLENARLNLQRNQQMFDRGIAAGKEVEDARAQLASTQSALEQANAALNTADRNVERAVVRSPIAGQVVKRMVSVGEQVDGTAAQPIAEIANLDRVELAANVPAEYLARIKVGQTTTVATDAFRGRTFAGSVLAIAPAVDATTNAGLVRIRITNTDRSLKVGMFAEARVVLETHRDALVVPPPAVVRTDDGAVVYVVSGDTAQRTDVKVGLEKPDAVEIVVGPRGRTNHPGLLGVRPWRKGEARAGAAEGRRRKTREARNAMNVARFARDNARVILLGVFLITLAGAYSITVLPSGIYPEVEFPRIVSVAQSGDLSPRLMMLAVTRPLEEAAREVLGVRRVRSRTIRGATELSVLFNPDADMRYALQLMQGKIEEARPEMPATTKVRVERMTPAFFPMMEFNVTGDLPPADIRDVAMFQLRPLLSRIDGISRVDVSATDEREVSVIVDPTRLSAVKVTLDQVSDALKSTNQIASVGRLPKDYKQYLVLATGELATLDDIRRVVVAFRNQTPVYVGDIADVREGVVDRTTLITGNGQPAAVISIARQIRGNILTIAQGVEQTLRENAKSLPPAIRVSKVYDLAAFVAEAVRSVSEAIVIGGLLAVFVLFAFLRDWRATFVAATTLPLTIVGSFFILHLAGGTINLMSMGGLAIAIGLVIDDAIVVVENIHRHLSGGDSPAVAAERGTNELVGAVVGSTLTTVVVFVPLAMLQGLVGQFFAALSLTLSGAVLLSLIYALLFIPVPAARLLKGRPQGLRDEDHAGGGGDDHGRREHGSIARRYESFLRRALARPGWVIAMTAIVAGVGGLLYFRLETGFLPSMDEGGYVIDYLTPTGTSLQETDKMVRRIEAVLQKHTGGGRVHPADRHRNGAVRDRAEQRRHSRPPQATRRARQGCGGDHLGATGALRAGAARGRDRVRPAAAGHARRPAGDAGTDRGQDLRRRHQDARRHRGAPGRQAREDRRSGGPRGTAQRQPRAGSAHRHHARRQGRFYEPGDRDTTLDWPAGRRRHRSPARGSPDRSARPVSGRVPLRRELDPRVPAHHPGRCRCAAIRRGRGRTGRRRGAAVSRRPQADGSHHRAARGPRHGERDCRTSSRCWRPSRCRSATPIGSAGSTRRSRSRFDRCSSSWSWRSCWYSVSWSRSSAASPQPSSSCRQRRCRSPVRSGSCC